MISQHAAIVYHPAKISLERLRAVVDDAQSRYAWSDSRWYPTDRHDSGTRATRRALDAGATVVIAAGGDGTVRAIAEAMHGGDVPLAIVPLGTGNLLARNLGLPLGSLDAAVQSGFAGGFREIDVALAELRRPDGSIDRHVFLVMAGIGLDSEMAEHTSAAAKRRIGWAAYAGPIARSVLGNRHFSLRYRIDGQPVRSAQAHTLIVGNCGMLAGRMLLLPRAVVDDGLLDVVMMRPGGRLGWARIGTRLTVQGLAHRTRFGRRLMRSAPELHALAYARGRRFDVRFDVPHTIQLDGDSFGSITSARVTAIPSALRVCGLS